MNRTSIRLLVLAVAALSLVALPALAERADDAARASKNGVLHASIDGVHIQVEYGRPKVKGRALWGSLVPYGEVWRTGADEATTIQVDGDVKINGQALSAGTYSLFTVPGESEWSFVFNKVAKQWGAYRYSQADDVLRVSAKPMATDFTEEMTFESDDSSITLKWGELAVGFTVSK